MPGRSIIRSVIFGMISAVHPHSMPGFLLSWSTDLRKVRKSLMKPGIPRLEQCCPHFGILTSVALAWIGIVLMDSRDNVILFWLPGSEIIRNKSWLLTSHMAHARCVKFLQVPQSGIQLFDHLITHEIRMFKWSFCTRLILMFFTLLVFIQSAASSGNTLSAMSITFGSLITCICCSWVKLKTYRTGCSNTWNLEMSRINLTIDSHQYDDVEASGTSLNHSIRQKVTSCRGKCSRAWSEHWQRIALKFLTAPKMPGKLWQKQPLMKWWREQCMHDVNSLYLSANNMTLIYPSHHWTMHLSDFTRRKVPFEIRECRSLRRPKWMNFWQENPIINENKRFIKSVLQWRFSCTGLKRLLHQNDGYSRCTWIEADRRQLYGQMLIGRWQSSDWSAKSIRRHLQNASFKIDYSNIMSANYCRKSGLRQPVPEAYSPKTCSNED